MFPLLLWGFIILLADIMSDKKEEIDQDEDYWNNVDDDEPQLDVREEEVEEDKIQPIPYEGQPLIVGTRGELDNMTGFQMIWGEYSTTGSLRVNSEPHIDSQYIIGIDPIQPRHTYPNMTFEEMAKISREWYTQTIE